MFVRVREGSRRRQTPHLLAEREEAGAQAHKHSRGGRAEVVSEILQLLRGNETSMRNGVVSSPKILNGHQGSVLSRTATLINNNNNNK